MTTAAALGFAIIIFLVLFVYFIVVVNNFATQFVKWANEDIKYKQAELRRNRG